MQRKVNIMWTDIKFKILDERQAIIYTLVKPSNTTTVKTKKTRTIRGSKRKKSETTFDVM